MLNRDIIILTAIVVALFGLFDLKMSWSTHIFISFVVIVQVVISLAIGWYGGYIITQLGI